MVCRSNLIKIYEKEVLYINKCIVVEPEIEGNLGFLARTMANFNFKKLILVNPKIKIGEEARNRAVHAQDILDNVKIVGKLEEALELVDFGIGTTGLEADSSSNVLRNTMDVREMAKRAGEVEGDIGIVLGRESKGLSNEELSMCDMVVKVPTSDDYPVMNITHAAGIVFYEIFREKSVEATKASSRGEKKYVKHIFKSIADNLDYSEDETDRIMQCLNNFIGRSFLDKKEANTLIGFFKEVEKNFEGD